MILHRGGDVTTPRRDFRNIAVILLLATSLMTTSCGRARAYADEGLQRMEQGKFTSALELFDRALRSNANEPAALYGKGMLLSEEQITEEIALSMLKQSVLQANLLEKYQLRAHVRIAEIYASRNDKAEAMQGLAKVSGTAKAMDSANAQRVADIYIKLNEKDRARETVTAYMESHPADESMDLYFLKLQVLVLKDNKAADTLCKKVNWEKRQSAKFLLNCTKLSASLNDYTTALQLVDLYLKRATAPVGKEINELRESIVRKRGKFDLVESDF
jgi:tetratricopeptide (TPR) repeat protein